MAESTRRHERLVERPLGDVMHSFIGPAGKSVDVMIPHDAARSDAFNLVVHFHGAAWLPSQAVAALGHHTVAATLNLGTGSGAYDRAFSNPLAFDTLLANITTLVAATTHRTSRVDRITLVGFSAGHGAVRAILRDARGFARVNAVLLLDGMHTSYVPEGQTLANGGGIDSTNLVAFANFARAAMRGDKSFLVTHSEIFPGTYASTTETADWVLAAIGLKRTPVLRWGPRGLQQLSEAKAGKFELRGFAGNSAPDHIDQFHALPEMLRRLLR